MDDTLLRIRDTFHPVSDRLAADIALGLGFENAEAFQLLTRFFESSKGRHVTRIVRKPQGNEVKYVISHDLGDPLVVTIRIA